MSFPYRHGQTALPCIMQARRQFLGRCAGIAALGVSGAALADSATYQRFHAALAADARLGPYADFAGELAGQAAVLGRLPKDLAGVFYRNGPGRFELGGERHHHWFDGDGFAQRWSIADGQVQHRGRFVATPKFEQESRAGRFLYSTFGTRVERAPVRSNDMVNVANTNLLPFNGSVYALWEGGSATELDPDTLATRGVKTWRPDLKSMPFSAHPKQDPDGGLWNFGIRPGSDQLNVYRLDAHGAVTRTAMLPVPQLNMVHDFVVSARHLVFLVPPYALDVPGKSLAERLRWQGAERPLRAVVVDKATLTVRQVFELPARSVFHLGNAWDDGAYLRFDAVLHQGDIVPEPALPMRGELRPYQAQRSSAVQITLDFASGQAREARLFGVSEFPRVAPQVVTRRHRKLLVLGVGAGSTSQVLDSVNLVDTDSGKVDGYHFGPGWQVYQEGKDDRCVYRGSQGECRFSGGVSIRIQEQGREGT